MKSKLKRLIAPLVIVSLSVNLILGVYIVQVKHNYESNIEILEENNKLLDENNTNLKSNISELEFKKDYYKQKYKQYFELSEELNNQLGVY